MYRQLIIVTGGGALSRPNKSLARVADESDLMVEGGGARGGEDLAWDANGRRQGRRRGRRRFRVRRRLRRFVKMPIRVMAYVLGIFRRPTTLEIIEGEEELRNSRVRIWFTPDPLNDPMNYMMMQSSLGVAWIF